MSLSTGLRLAIGTTLVVLSSVSFGSTVTVSQTNFPGQSSTLHADFNGDGREDFVYNAIAGFAVQLSTGDGTYAAPVTYTMPNSEHASAIAIGDFNNDGKADLAVFGINASQSGGLHLYVNNGSGTFSHTAFFPLSSQISYAAVADFNHDGFLDIAFQSDAPDGMTVWLGNGKGGFKAGPNTHTYVSGPLMLADFDGDGKADIAIQDIGSNYNTVEVHYGDGTGAFPEIQTINLPAGRWSSAVADVNGDGKMDIVATRFYPTVAKYVAVYYGNARRTWTDTTIIPLAHCARETPFAADMNGDGINDLIVPETDDCSNTLAQGNHYIGVLTRNSNSSYNPEQTIYTSPSASMSFIFLTVLRANRDTKPDLAITQCVKAPCAFFTPAYDLRVLLNTSAGNFHTCQAPNAFEGINVCSPGSGSVVASPVSFRLGAAGQVIMRKMEVWVDGHKLAEQLGGFSNYTFLDRSLSLNGGSHQVDIYASGWDNSLQRKSFKLNVQ